MLTVFATQKKIPISNVKAHIHPTSIHSNKCTHINSKSALSICTKFYSIWNFVEMMATNVYKLTECVSQNTKIIVMFEAYALGLPSPHPCISWKKGPWTATNSNKISRVWSAHTYMRTHWLTKLSSPSPSSSSVCLSHSSNQCTHSDF